MVVKWNKIEHRMFCHITQNRRGKPLVSHEVVVNLIGSTTTRKGLKIRAGINENEYQIGIKISDKEMAELKIKKEDFHGELITKYIREKPKFVQVDYAKFLGKSTT